MQIIDKYILLYIVGNEYSILFVSDFVDVCP